MNKYTLIALLFNLFQGVSQVPNLNFNDFVEIEDAYDKNCRTNSIAIPSWEYLNIDCLSGGYHLILNDEFNGSDLNGSMWNSIIGVPRDFDFQSQKAWHLPENNIVSNGTLKITADKLVNPYSGTWVTNWSTNPVTEKTADFDYITGEIWSKYRFMYGVYEIRCKIPKGKGFWPAFWTYGGNVWNEIDVFEFWNEFNFWNNFDEDKSVQNMHTNYHHVLSENLKMDCPNEEIINGIDFSSNFHTFTLIFDPGYIAWLVDGIPIRFENKYRRGGIHFGTGNSGLFFSNEIMCEEIEDDDKTYYKDAAMPEEPMYIVANLAIQNGIKSNGILYENEQKPDNQTTFPQSLEIEYIRHWKKFDCPTSLFFPNKISLNLNYQNVYNAIMGTNVTINNVDFNDNDQLHIIYNDYIEFQDVNFSNTNEITIEYLPNFNCNNQGLIVTNENDVEKFKNDSLVELEKESEFLFSETIHKSTRYMLYDLNGRIVQKGEELKNKQFHTLKQGMYIYVELNDQEQIVKYQKIVL